MSVFVPLALAKSMPHYWCVTLSFKGFISCHFILKFAGYKIESLCNAAVACGTATCMHYFRFRVRAQNCIQRNVLTACAQERQSHKNDTATIYTSYICKRIKGDVKQESINLHLIFWVRTQDV